MNRAVFWLMIFMIPALFCSRTVSVPERHDSQPLQKNLHSFFSMCERDLHNAARVISDRDLIRNLTHLHRMNAGGKKYYLLEREAITEMIKSVTEGIYSDFILINRHEVVIYTRENDQIFGKKVSSSLIGSPLDHCVKNSSHGMYIEDISAFPPESGQYNLFISATVLKEETVHGVFILQVGTGKIEEAIPPNTTIIDREGIIRVSRNHKDLLSPYPFYGKMDVNGIGKDRLMVFENADIVFKYFPFEFRNLKWIIVVGR